jgi:hypothetical protein
MLRETFFILITTVFPLRWRPRTSLLMLLIPLQSLSQDLTFIYKREVQLQAKKIIGCMFVLEYIKKELLVRTPI